MRACSTIFAFVLLAAGNVYSQNTQAPIAVPVQGNNPNALELVAPVAPTDPDAVLSVGDQVTLVIEEDREDLPVVKMITATGDLDVPYIGRVRAAGKTTAQVAAEVKRQLEADFYYKATVRLNIDTVNRQATVSRIYLSGEVHAPGPQQFYQGEKVTVSAAILKAGGFAQFADDRKVMVTRKKGDSNETFTVDVKAVLEKGQRDKDRVLQAEDYIHVPKKLFNF